MSRQFTPRQDYFVSLIKRNPLFSRHKEVQTTRLKENITVLQEFISLFFQL